MTCRQTRWPTEWLMTDERTGSRLWAALTRASGGTWAGCVYDVDRIVAALDRAAIRPDEEPDGKRK